MRYVAALAALALTLAACGGDDSRPETLRLLTHESFAVSDEVFATFAEETGIEVEVIRGGDAGSMVTQAALTAGNPVADVIYGVDTTFLSRALDADLFVPHEADGIEDVDPALLGSEDDLVTPVNFGDVCLNYDRAWFAERDLAVPETLEDLIAPEYEGLLVVQNPATSSPGLAFVLATIAHFGEDGWLDYWARLRDNGVAVAQGWEDAYFGQFTWGSGGDGDRPLVVSYASSPPAEVLAAEEEVDEAPTGVLLDSCYRQIEFAGILAGTEHREEAEQLIDFMLSTELQEDIPLQMFVFPVNADAVLPDVFVEHVELADEPLELAPDRVGAARDDWIEEWTDTVLR